MVWYVFISFDFTVVLGIVQDRFLFYSTGIRPDSFKGLVDNSVEGFAFFAVEPVPSFLCRAVYLEELRWTGYLTKKHPAFGRMDYEW